MLRRLPAAWRRAHFLTVLVGSGKKPGIVAQHAVPSRDGVAAMVV